MSDSNHVNKSTISWRDHLRTVEVAHAEPLAGALFKRRFGHDVPSYPRHFVLFYYPDSARPESRVVAYVHQMPLNEVYLGGGMCVDEAAYRILPKWLFSEIRREGGLATIVTRDSIAL